MRKFILSVVLAIVGALVAEAAITLSTTLNDNYQTKIENRRVRDNRRTCRNLGLAASCTQTDACTKVGLIGAACTPTAANDKSARIFAATQNGRENHAEALLRKEIDEGEDIVSGREDKQDFCDWWTTVLDDAGRAAECARWSSPATCTPVQCR